MSGKPTPHPRLNRVFFSGSDAPYEVYGHDENGRTVQLNNPAVLAKYLDRVYFKSLGDLESAKTRNFPMAEGEKLLIESLPHVEAVRRWAMELVRESVDPNRKRNRPARPVQRPPIGPSPATQAWEGKALAAIQQADRYLASRGLPRVPKREAPPPPPPEPSPRRSLQQAEPDESQAFASADPPGGAGRRIRGGLLVNPEQERNLGGNRGRGLDADVPHPESPSDESDELSYVDDVLFRLMMVDQILSVFEPLIEGQKTRRVLRTLNAYYLSFAPYIGDLRVLKQDRTARVLDFQDALGQEAFVWYVRLMYVLKEMEEGILKVVGGKWCGPWDWCLNSDEEALEAVGDSVDAALQAFATLDAHALAVAGEEADEESAKAMRR